MSCFGDRHSASEVTMAVDGVCMGATTLLELDRKSPHRLPYVRRFEIGIDMVPDLLVDDKDFHNVELELKLGSKNPQPCDRTE